MTETLIIPPDPWPICAPLPCTCLGDSELTADQALNITMTSCPSSDTVIYHQSVLNKTYTVAKRDHCGTFKPTDPTRENQCTCPDLEESKLKRLKISYVRSTL